MAQVKSRNSQFAAQSQSTSGNNDDKDNRDTVKIVLLGDQGVGKSSIGFRYVHGSYIHNRETTIGAALFTTRVSVDETNLRLEIWDTAGQERFQCLLPMYYRNALGVIIVYDITSKESFVRAKEWIRKLRDLGQDSVIILVGNKVDVRREARAVTPEDGSQLAEDFGLIFVETSAKTGQAVDEIFTTIAHKIWTEILCKPESELGAGKSGGIRLGGNAGKTKAACCKGQ